ncbi:hypothetical protein X978_3353 [Burkholderia pseudomallei MSHR3965]|nr:hypothetical protein X978_3353 [Burkholderia pseudomallei MSHR3965]
MKKIAAVLLTAGSLALAGPASAHDRGGVIVGALIGGAVLGAIMMSALMRRRRIRLRRIGRPLSAGAISAGAALRCAAVDNRYDAYRRAYVGCGAQAYDDGYRGYGSAQPWPAGW